MSSGQTMSQVVSNLHKLFCVCLWQYNLEWFWASKYFIVQIVTLVLGMISLLHMGGRAFGFLGVFRVDLEVLS